MEKVDFISHGLRLQANFHTPEGPGPHPTLIVQHGFSGVKEMVDDFCAYFVRHGFACFAYDYPTLGESEGEPRSDSDPIAQIRSIRDAVSFLELRDDVDSDRIGFWGSSYSGGHAIAIAALEKRVKCVVSQVPLVNGMATMRALQSIEGVAQLREALNEESRSMMRGNPPSVLPVSVDDPTAPQVFPGRRTSQYLKDVLADIPTWRNQATLRTVGYVMDYDVTGHVPEIGITPLLMIIGKVDEITPIGPQLDVYRAAGEPKKLVIVDGDHYSVYEHDKCFEPAAAAAAAWFVEHLPG
jgi:uncharacterized protein